jgi:hypothetical protein
MSAWRWRWLGLAYIVTLVAAAVFAVLRVYTDILGPADTSGLSGVALVGLGFPLGVLGAFLFEWLVLPPMAGLIAFSLLQGGLVFWLCRWADLRRTNVVHPSG